MKRSRVDGTAFQLELERAAEKSSAPLFVVRLRTPQSRQANVTNISDFILYGRVSTILEVKETGEKYFSLNTFQQKEEVEKFQKFFSQAKSFYNFTSDRPYRLAVLVHFMKQHKFTLYYLEDSPFVVMHPDDTNCLTWSTLKEAIDYLANH